MANDNCLEGIKCPKCGHEDRFFIDIECLCEVTDDGAIPSDQNQGMEWQDNSFIRCDGCGESGTVADFMSKPTPEPKPIAGSIITEESKEYMKKTAMELANNATVALNNTLQRIREEQPKVAKNVRYLAQYILEELVAELQRRV